jgi:hypothetical protein
MDHIRGPVLMLDRAGAAGKLYALLDGESDGYISQFGK